MLRRFLSLRLAPSSLFAVMVLGSPSAAPAGSNPAAEREIPGFGSGALELPYAAQYVGSEQCGRCHREQYRRQRGHPMALSGRAVTRDTRDLWFSPELLSKPIDWTSARELPPLRYRADPEGAVLELRPTNQAPRQVRVAAVFGSGVHGITPVSVEEGKRIRELRLSFSAARDRWFTTPGSEADPDPFGTPKSPEQSGQCLSCHATLLSWRKDRLDVASSVFGVGCERCHGPGSAHLEAVLSSSSDGPRIFNPGSLRPDEQVKFCGQCHRRPSDMDPLDLMTHAPGLARHAGASLMMSACFRRSPPEKTVSCLDCHDPHSNLEPETDRTRTTCLRCHSQPEREHWSESVSSSSDCASCHLPKQEKGFHGVEFDDHWIQIPASPNPMNDPAKAEYLRYLEQRYREAIERSGGGAETKAAVRMHLGEVLYGEGDPESAFRWLREGLSYSPSYRQRLKAAGMFRQSGELQQAVDILKEAVRTEPELAEAHYDLGELFQSQGKLDQAIESYKAALAANPLLAAAENSLGSALGARGRLEEAMSHFRRALELKPDYLEAHNNLGIALRRVGELAEAASQFREAIRLGPNWAAPLHALARILATHPDSGLGSAEEAIRLADRAAELTRYEHPAILDTLAAAYAAAGRFEKAMKVGEEALRLSLAAKDEELAREIRERLSLYRQHRPYRESPF